jgi:oxygen-independent coproporphyrinogen-3 oxidase
MAGIYLHIPFCKQACYYCDFHFSTSQQYKTEMLETMKHEIALQRSYLDHEHIDTIYFGGGTPSLLQAEEINILLDEVFSHHEVDSNAEITLEANPDDLIPAE